MNFLFEKRLLWVTVGYLNSKIMLLNVHIIYITKTKIGLMVCCKTVDISCPCFTFTLYYVYVAHITI